MSKYGHVWPRVSGHPLFASLAIPMAIFFLEKLIDYCKDKYKQRPDKRDDFEEIRKFLASQNT